MNAEEKMLLILGNNFQRLIPSDSAKANCETIRNVEVPNMESSIRKVA